MKKLNFLSLLLAMSFSFLMGSCKNKSDSPIIEPDLVVTVRFYIDYNHQSTAEDIYYSCQVKNGSLITDKPTDPQNSNYSEFPNFKGWSEKEIIDNYDDLWNFDTDLMNSTMQVFRIYGIWMAPGE